MDKTRERLTTRLEKETIGCTHESQGVDDMGHVHATYPGVVHPGIMTNEKKLTGVVAKPDLSITEADDGYNVRVECEVRR